MLIRIAVRMDTHAIGLYNHRMPFLQSHPPGFCHGIHRIKNILAVTMDNGQILETRKLLATFRLAVWSFLGTEIPYPLS